MKILYTIAAFAALLTFKNSFAQDQKNYLYLENSTNGKVKKLNLDRMSYLQLGIDSITDECSGSISYEKWDAEGIVFGADNITFPFDYYDSYSDCLSGDKNTVITETIYDANGVITFPYTDASRNVDLYLVYQKPFRNVLSNFGIGLCLASAFTAFAVAPMIGLNDGSFQNYSWGRMWRWEAYSGIGLLAGFTLGATFSDRWYYFQSQEGDDDTWKVVTP